MPELLDEIYCSEQICIPPTFPYLLRQFAKAAIRTQPNDLLKWSTTYFRCLSLNIPPPVKTRLEYPIPKDFKGLTPGWLKTLYKQFGNTKMVTFRLLYDRWTGACLSYDDLIKILCLGKFDNNQEISIHKFLCLCAGFLTENLTKTMILICEIFTEEPDGGSAMITKQLFLDCYQFLACQIDASIPQIVCNYHFLEKFLIDKDDSVIDVSGDKKDEDVKIVEETHIESKSGSVSEITNEPDEISITSDNQITPADYLHLITESQATLRPLEDEKEQTDTASCSIDEEIPNEIQEYLEKIQQVDGEGDGKQQKPQKQQQPHDEQSKIVEAKIEKSEQKSDEDTKEIDETPEFEEIEIEIVPGIGPLIPQQLFDNVCKYFHEMGELQNGMVMPRNIRHYDCPPLEIINN